MRPLRQLIALTTLVATPLAASCSSETVGPPPTPPVNWQSLTPKPKADAGPTGPTARERRLAELYASALGSSARSQADAGGPADAIAGLAALLDDDARFTFPGWQDVHGRDAVVRAHQLLFGAFNRRSTTLSRVWRTPASQALEWTMTGLQARDWMSVAATGRPVSITGLTVLSTGDEGTIADVHVYFDVAAAKAQLGAGPKELQAAMAAAPPGLAGDAGATGDAGAAGAPVIFDQTGGADELSAVMLARGVLDALEANRESAYVDAMSDDVEIRAPERPTPWRGKAEARAYFRALRKAIGQLDTTVTSAQGVASFAVVEYTIAGEQLGPFFWIPAQRDKAIRLHLAEIVEIAAGKVRRVYGYGNPAEILAPSPD
jgi:hypothetical protein